MCVGYLIADDLAQYPLGVESFSLGQCNFPNYFEISADIGKVPDPAYMLFWDHLDVARRVRMDVEECNEVVVFIDDMCGNLLVDDLAEDTVFHECIVIHYGSIWNKNPAK